MFLIQKNLVFLIYLNIIIMYNHYYLVNYRIIYSLVKPFVSTIVIILSMKRINVIPPKAKNNGYALLSFTYNTTPVTITLIVAAIHFIIVANGTIFAGIISGTYIHIAGPNDRPNINTYIISRANTTDPDQESPKIENIPKRISTIPKDRFPKRMRPFLPKLMRINNVKIAERNWAAQITRPVY